MLKNFLEEKLGNVHTGGDIVQVLRPSEKLAKINKKCAIKLYQENAILRRRENFLIGPFAMQVALAFTQSICTHGSAKEILRFFGISREPNKIKFAVTFKNEFEKICSDSYTLENHLKFFIEKDLIVDKSVKEVVSVYSAQIEHINFLNNIDETTETINAWIRDQSKHEFDALKRTTLKNYSKIVLVNVPYLKAKWQNPALSHKTKKRRFYKFPNGVVEVEMMRFEQQNLNYYESFCLDAQILKLPITGDETSMTLILPRKIEGVLKLAKCDKIFTSFKFKRIPIDVTLPKFKIENRINMKDVLQDLGVEKVFLKCQDNINGIYDKRGKPIALNDVIQGACINVNEEGIETDNASEDEETVSTEPHVIDNENKEIKTFVANRPFIFYIKAKNIIVLAGQVMDPFDPTL